MEHEYVEHPAKVVRLDSDQLKAFDPESKAEVTVWSIAREKGVFEGLLAEPISDGVLQLHSIPVFTRGPRFLDVVAVWTDEETGALVVTDVKGRSDYATVRVELASPAWELLMQHLEHLNVWFDMYNELLLSLAVPMDHLAEVLAVLNAWRADGRVLEMERIDSPVEARP